MEESNTENANSEMATETEAPQQEAQEVSQETKPEYSDLEKQYYERIKKLEAENKELKSSPQDSQESPLPTESKPKLDTDTKVDLRMDGYSKEEIAYIERNMGDRSIDDTLADPFVKAGIEGIRGQQKAEAETPAPSSTVPTFTKDKKTFADMSHEERKANFESIVGAVQKKGATSNE